MAMEPTMMKMHSQIIHSKLKIPIVMELEIIPMMMMTVMAGVMSMKLRLVMTL